MPVLPSFVALPESTKACCEACWERCFLQETTRGSLSSFRKLKYLWNWKQTGASTGEKTKSAFKKLQSLRIHLSIRSKFSSSFLPKSKKKHPKRGRAAQSSAAKAQCQAARRGGRAPPSSPEGRLWRKEADHSVWSLRSDSVLHSRQLHEVTWGQCLALLADCFEPSKIQLMGAPLKQTRYPFYRAVPVEKTIILH